MSLTRRRALVLGAVVMLVAGVLAVGRLTAPGETKDQDETLLPRAAEEFLGEIDEKDLEEGSQGVANGGAGGGSDPIAVGKRMASAPINAMARALSGNHWSQQMPAPKVP